MILIDKFFGLEQKSSTATITLVIGYDNQLIAVWKSLIHVGKYKFDEVRDRFKSNTGSFVGWKFFLSMKSLDSTLWLLGH